MIAYNAVAGGFSQDRELSGKRDRVVLSMEVYEWCGRHGMYNDLIGS